MHIHLIYAHSFIPHFGNPSSFFFLSLKLHFLSSLLLQYLSSMEFIPPSEHLCYVRCNFCNTVLVVGIPCKRVLDTVTVKCGHCSSLSFLATKQEEPPFQAPQCLGLQMMSGFQGFSHDQPKAQPFSAPSSSSVIKATPMAPKESHVIKPPERKHRIPSAYNKFMKEEIQWIKTANAQIPHREALALRRRIGLGTFLIHRLQEVLR